MDDKDLLGKLVFLSIHCDKWLRDANPTFNVPMANRLARVSKVFDWDTEEGKLLLIARERTGKWGSLEPKDFKFVLTVFYPDLKKGEKLGIKVEEVLPRHLPGTTLEIFSPVPDWMILEFAADDAKEPFTIVPKKRSRSKGK
jgi:hypothetical protein